MSFIQWNAHVHIEGATAKWIGLGWGIPDDSAGNPNDYFAHITVAAPSEANATIGKVGVNESVALTSRDAGCEDGAIVIDVTYRVECREGTGRRVEVNVAENAGQKGIPTGGVLAHGEGDIDQPITVTVRVPGNCGGLSQLLANLGASRSVG